MTTSENIHLHEGTLGTYATHHGDSNSDCIVGHMSFIADGSHKDLAIFTIPSRVEQIAQALEHLAEELRQAAMENVLTRNNLSTSTVENEQEGGAE